MCRVPEGPELRGPGQRCWRFGPGACHCSAVRASVVLAAFVALSGCGTADTGSSQPLGYDVAEEVPHPGIAEGRPIVKIEHRGTFYLCPELAVGRTTPLLTDPCLVDDPDVGHTRIEGYSMLDASVGCANGRSATDAGTLGIGFVGEPLVGDGQSSPDSGAVLECLWGLDRK